jgi:short subunit dehydrogenase-like uncharacterized protein
MQRTILLYGATGFTGRLIAAEGERQLSGLRAGDRMILAGRDGERLSRIASQHGMRYRVFGLDDRDDIVHGLRDVDVVINAAGPFAFTAERLAKAALQADCHYVDINGEVDVYRKLDDLGRFAAQRKLAIVCSAGHTAAASDLLLDAALRHLKEKKEGGVAPKELLGAVRIAMSRIVSFTRGSAETVARSMREEVTVVRRRTTAGPGGPGEELALWHEPVGKLERTFDFRDRASASAKADLRIASAANLVDTLTARLTIPRNDLSVRRIESYVETNAADRIAYQLGALLAPMSSLPWVRELTKLQIGLLPEGPSTEELQDEGHLIVLEIEDAFRKPILDLRWRTPNVYQLTAQLVVAVAEELATQRGQVPPGGPKFPTGWCTPAELLPPLALPREMPAPLLAPVALSDESLPPPPLPGETPAGAFRGCQLTWSVG